MGVAAIPVMRLQANRVSKSKSGVGHYANMIHAQAQAQAKAIVKVLEDHKISGRDYPLELLSDLRSACSSAGISVRTSTGSGRDAIFRTAVAAALLMAQDGSSGLIAGCTPPQFICGLAADLGADSGSPRARICSRICSLHD